MKRYIKPQIEILNTNLSEDMLQTASRQEDFEVDYGMAKKDPFSFADEQSAQKAPLQSDITIDSVWE